MAISMNKMFQASYDGVSTLYNGAAKVGKIQAQVGVYLSMFVTALLTACTVYLIVSKRDPKQPASDKWTKVAMASFATFIMAVVTWSNAWLARNSSNGNVSSFKKAARASQGISLMGKLI
jgi:hypothetical protein